MASSRVLLVNWTPRLGAMLYETEQVPDVVYGESLACVCV
jgi:hypothetical protein